MTQSLSHRNNFDDDDFIPHVGQPLYPLTPPEMQQRINELTAKCLKLEDENDCLRDLLQAHMRHHHAVELAAQEANNGA